MDTSAFVAAFGAFMAIIGVPCGILFREVIKSKDAAMAQQAADCARELAARDREIKTRDDRLEAAHITETRLIEIALRSTAAGEKAADVAATATTRGRS